MGNSLGPYTCNWLQIKHHPETATASPGRAVFNPLRQGNTFQVTSSAGEGCELLKQQGK